jgi:hypothetical protein
MPLSPHKSSIYSESWNLPSPVIPSHWNRGVVIGATSHLPYAYGNHPITLQIVSQLSQDLYQASRLQSSDLLQLERSLIRDGWQSFCIESIFVAIMCNKSYLVLDWQDGGWVDAPNTNNDPTPFKVYGSVPTVGRVLSDSGQRSSDNETIHPDRYVEWVSPFRFHLPTTLNTELDRHDRITTGIENQISGQGLVTVGIENLYELMVKGGQAVQNLTERLMNLRGAKSGDGLISHDKNRESITVTPKPVNREPESLTVIENRISAICGLPGFLIWGYTDSDGHSLSQSLNLYSQRIGALAQQSVTPSLFYICQLIDDDDDLWVGIRDLYPETPLETAERLEKMVAALANMQSIGAITAIEVRNTIHSEPSFGLVLQPNPVIVTEPATPELTTETTGGSNDAFIG